MRQWITTLPAVEGFESICTPGLTAQAIAVLGEDVVSWVAALSQRTVVSVLEALQGDGFFTQQRIRTGRFSAESAMLRALMFVVTEDRENLGLTEETKVSVAEWARRPVPLALVMRGTRMTHAALTDAVLRHADDVLEDSAKGAEMRLVSDLLFEHMHDYTNAVEMYYLDVEQQWRQSADARRTETLTALLAGKRMDVDQASARLSYRLDREHIAAVVWKEPPYSAGEEDRALGHIAARAFSQAGCAGVLVHDGSPDAVWVWGASRNQPINRAAFEKSLPSGVRAALGSPAFGPDGFRASHVEALKCAEFIWLGSGEVTAEVTGAVTTYLDLELAILLANDLELARTFVSRQLRGLAARSPRHEMLRHTLRVYLGCERSLAAAADQLHIARNTVTYRLQLARDVLGHDLRERRLELECALQLAAHLGDQVLPKQVPSLFT